MGKRRRTRKRREEEQEEVGECTCIPPTSVRRKIDHQSPPDPSSPSPPPPHPLSMRSRCPTRAFLANCGTMQTPLRSPVRNVKSVPCVSSASSPQRNVLAKNVDQSSPLMDKIPSPDGPQALEPVSSLHTITNSRAAVSPPPHQNADGHNQKGNPSCPASFVNCTEIAARVANDSFDPDEVASNACPALVTVNGYRVKEEMAPLLRSIISKYGDIGKECTFQSPEVRSSLMEKVCGIYRNLELADPVLFTPVELKSTVNIVEDLESARINVKWLHKRLDEINEAFQLTKGYLALKDAQAANLIAVERKKKAMQDELDAMVAEGDNITEALLGTKAKIKIFFSESLVHGLL